MEGQSDFELLKKILHEEKKVLTGMAIDFSQDNNGNPLNQQRIKQEIFLGGSATPKDYIVALLAIVPMSY